MNPKKATVLRGEISLSPKEELVLDKIMLGLCYKEIAEELNISNRTAEIHGQRIMKKRKAPNKYVLMAWEFRRREAALLRKIASLEAGVVAEQQ